ncbi:MAG: tetratricopeptide repeat protein [Spirochaetales bacterium]|nr:tetratricopeptide repeat protein [Spirochaetales bacterium]
MLVLLPVAAAVWSGDVTVDYIFGTVEVRSEAGWLPVEIGTAVADNALLRLGAASVAELSSGGLKITLSEAGTYIVSELTKSSRQVSSWGIGKIVRAKIRNLFSTRNEQYSDPGGVRQERIEGPGIEFMDEEVDAVEEGKSALEQERYEEAVQYFEEALELDYGRNRPLYLFYIGYAYAMAGRYGPAMRYLSESELSPSSEHYADYVLIKGQLLLETQSCQAAQELFEQFVQRYADHEYTQTVHLLSAFCSIRLGQRAAAEQSLKKACDLDPSSDAGKQARAMLDSL